MSAILAPLALTAATAALLALPLAPAVIEARKRRDALPLSTRKDDAEIRNFARNFRHRMAPLFPELAACTEERTSRRLFFNGEPAVLVGEDGIFGELNGREDALVLLGRRATFLEGMTFTRDVYAADTVQTGGRNVFRALLADGDVYLGRESAVLRWLHSLGSVEVEPCCALHGRLSAEQTIRLSTGCSFERVQAAVIYSGAKESPRLLVGCSAYGKRSIIDVRLGRIRVNGDFHLGSGEMMQGHVVASGTVHVDEDAKIVGSVKSNGDAAIGARTEIHGTMVSAGRLTIAGNCFTRGPVLAEKEVIIGQGTQVGTPDCPTTISAPRIRIGCDSVVYGTLWARTLGTIEG